MDIEVTKKIAGDIVAAIQSINYDIYHSSGKLHKFDVSFKTNGNYVEIVFGGIQICFLDFSSLVKPEIYPIEEYLRERINTEISILNTVKV